METSKCGVCDITLTPENVNQRTKQDLCAKCYTLQLQIFKQGVKSLPYKPPSQISEKIWLGEEASATDVEKLRALGIKRILIVASLVDKLFPKDFNYLAIDIDDFPTADLYSRFDEIFTFISEAEKAGEGVLVHCVSGMSRSASAVISYLMRKERWTFEHAQEYVKSKRPCIRPNSGFVEQLKKYEKVVLSMPNS